MIVRADDDVRARGRLRLRQLARCGLAFFLPALAPAAVQAGFAERDITPAIGSERPGGYESRLTSHRDLDIRAGRRFAEAGVELASGLEPGPVPQPPPLRKPGEPWLFGNVPPQLD